MRNTRTTFLRGLALALTLAGLPNLSHAQDREPLDGADDDRVSPDLVQRDARGDVVLRDNAAGFGAEGQWTFSTDASLSLERRTQSGTEATTTISIFPAADYFVIRNLSVGGVIGVGHTRAGDNRSTVFRLGPRVGYNVRFSELLSLWPKLGVSYAHTKAKSSADLPSGVTVTSTTENDAVQLNLFVPVMLHPAPHFFAGFGPFVDTDLNGDHRATTWGLRLTLGGWI